MQLSEFLEIQLTLQRDAFGIDPTQLTGEARLEYVRWNVLALENELHEMLQETDWKPWSTGTEVHAERALKEMVDAFHFFLNLLLALGQPIDGDEAGTLAAIFEVMYGNKAIRNAERQAEGYDGTNKCPQCHRALDDVGIIQVVTGDGSWSRSACGACYVALPDCDALSDAEVAADEATWD